MSEQGPYIAVNLTVRRRTLEVLLPMLERAMDAPFEDNEIQVELGNVRNAVRNTLQTVPILIELNPRAEVV